MRLSMAVQSLVLIIIGCGVYTVANQYQMIEKQVNTLDEQSEQEHENIRVLQAEWAFLTNPTRLEKIAGEHFQLESMDGTQMVALNTLPLRATLDAQDAESGTAAQQPADPVEVTPQEKNLTEEPQIVARNLPASAALPPARALPPMDITPVSDQRGAQ